MNEETNGQELCLHGVKMKLVKCLTNSVKIYNFATETKQVKGYRK